MENGRNHGLPATANRLPSPVLPQQTCGARESLPQCRKTDFPCNTHRMAAKVTIFIGPARSGKTQRLLNFYRAVLRQGQEVSEGAVCLWLAPSHDSVAELRDALMRETNDAFLEPGITTFAGFAERIVTSGSRRVRPLSRLQKRFLLRQVVDEAVADGQLTYLAPVAHTPGFLAQLDEWIAELKRQDIWADDSSRRAGDQRMRELALVYQHYQRRLLQDDLYDAEGRFWAAREILQQNATQRPLEYGLVVVDGFSDFTAAQLDILRLLAERSAEMHLSLASDPVDRAPADPSTGRALLFVRVRRTCERLQQLLPDLCVEAIPPSRSGPGCLRQIERNLFRDEAVSTLSVPKQGRHQLEIVAASGVQNEIEEIAGRIKTALHTHRARPQDFLVVFPHLTESAPRVAEVFGDYGIPHWIESRPRLAASPLVRALVSLLRLRIKDWPFRLLLEVVGNRLIAIFDQTADSELRAGLEPSIRAAQLPSGRKRLFEQLRKWSSDPSPGREERARQATAALVSLEQLAAALDGLPERATLEEWTARLEQLLVELGIITGETASAAWGTLRKGLHAINLVDGGQSGEVHLDQLLELVELVAADQPLPASLEAVGRVRVLAAESARHTSASHVYLAGLSEQAFSSAARSDQLEVSTDALARQSDAMFLFYALVTRATESLTLSYPALDDKGQQLPPSPLLIELERCFGPEGIPKTRLPLGEALVTDAEPLSRSTHRQMAVAQAQKKDPSWLAGLLLQPDPAGAAVTDAILSIASRARRDQFGDYEGLLKTDAAQDALARRFGADHLWSPSQLEGYATCPFRFFAENLLELEPLDDLTVSGDAGRRGSLLHHVLATVQTQLLEHAAESLEDQAWQEDLAERFRRALDAHVAAMALGGVEQSLREIQRRQIAAWATDYARQESEYRTRWRQLDEPPRPTYFEVRFGPEVKTDESSPRQDVSTPLAFELDLGEEKIRITGQIDRIDVGRVGGVTVLNVIDYKSGKQVQLKEEQMHAGRQLQLPLYALAAEELLLADQGARALAAGYWSIQGQGFEKGALELRRVEGHSLCDSDDWQRLRPQILITVRQLVTGIRAGQFPVFNEDQLCTRWCPHSTVCRVGQIRNLEKQWPPPEAPQS